MLFLVTATGCSNWAESFRSLVTTVHPSLAVETLWVPHLVGALVDHRLDMVRMLRGQLLGDLANLLLRLFVRLPS
jgi:hypothetical protein